MEELTIRSENGASLELDLPTAELLLQSLQCSVDLSEDAFVQGGHWCEKEDDGPFVTPIVKQKASEEEKELYHKLVQFIKFHKNKKEDN